MAAVPQVVHKVPLSDGRLEIIVDPAGLEMFKSAVVGELNTQGMDIKSHTSTLNTQNASIQNIDRGIDRAMDRIRSLEDDVKELVSFVGHIAILHPEWVDSFKKTEAVKARLDDAAEIREVQEAIV